MAAGPDDNDNGEAITPLPNAEAAGPDDVEAPPAVGGLGPQTTSGGVSSSALQKEQVRPKPGMADYLAGEQKQFISLLKPFLPQELVGGTLPHIPGTEEEAVWNAASQACGTEKVHYC